MVVHFLSLQTALLSDEQLHCLLGFMYAHYYPTDTVSWPAIIYQLQQWRGTPKKRTVKLRYSSANTQKKEKKKSSCPQAGENKNNRQSHNTYSNTAHTRKIN